MLKTCTTIEKLPSIKDRDSTDHVIALYHAHTRFDLDFDLRDLDFQS